ncbi:MAG: serine hydrolase [Saprospiraceae bacterium]|nr:serine hydrolase [Saprospiraceae bacterium]
MKNILITILFFCFLNLSYGQQNGQKAWVDSVLNKLSVEQKLGQLFVIRSFATNTDESLQNILSLIQNYHVGGVCFFKGTIPKMIELNNLYQSNASIPLLMSMDAEWGLGMRMLDGFSFPKQMSLGAIQDNQLVYKMGKEMGYQLKSVGIHMNYAPVLDINNNINNPVINERSFGSNRKQVLAKSFALMQGMQDAGVLASLKHFPGHGDTEIDSHHDLPTLSYSKKRIDSLEMFPFKGILNFNPASIMVGHLNIPSLDSSSHLPATLSKRIIIDYLRNSLGYQGLIITDALEMKGITKTFSTGEIAIKAFQAGNDILLLSENVPEAVAALKQALVDQLISETELNEKVTRILIAKYKVGLHHLKPILLDTLGLKMSTRRSKVLKEQIFKKAITLARDPNKLVPIQKIPSNIISLNLNAPLNNIYQKRLQDYTNVNTYSINTLQELTPEIENALQNSELILISVHKLNYLAAKNYGLNLELIQKLNSILVYKKNIINFFGCPYASMYFPTSSSMLLLYEDNDFTQDLAAQLLFGADAILGNSPITAGMYLTEGKGIHRPSLSRIGFSFPESQGMNMDTLQKIDSIAYELIFNKAAPGCQVVVIKNQQVVFRKSYGYFTYDSVQTVENQTMYDVASLTKIICSAPILMILNDRNLIQFQSTFSRYLPEFSTSNKSDLSIKDFMLHQGKLVSWIPFYKSTLTQPDSINRFNPSYYSTSPSLKFNIPVCDSFYLLSSFRDSIFTKILESNRLNEKKYLYSDIGFYFLPKLILKQTKQSFENFYLRNLIIPIGLRFTTFNPLFHHFEKNQIAPTEIDNYFRHREIRAYVHDMGAAMLGGVSGHAGVFSTATEVAMILQLFLNKGNYGGIEYITAGTVSKCIERDPEFSRRALLFDMPELQETDLPYVSRFASKKTFGHQGFTGTCAWADPENQLIFVFLSNRTYQDSKSNLLHKNRYRTKIQDLIYRSIESTKNMSLN